MRLNKFIRQQRTVIPQYFISGAPIRDKLTILKDQTIMKIRNQLYHELRTTAFRGVYLEINRHTSSFYRLLYRD